MGWQDEFKLRGNLLQEHVYPFEIRLRELGGTKIGPIANSAHLLKAAIYAGWIEVPEAEIGVFGDEQRYMLAGENVDKLLPGKLLWYGGLIAAAYSRSMDIPPN